MLPLDGYRIADITHAHAGPSGTALLADMGADVIKVEPLDGDGVRAHSLRIDKKGVPTHFLAINRNKRSLTVDLKTERGREILLRLVEKSDALVSNMRPGALDKLGLSYEVASQRNPGIIYATLSGLGPKGPEADKPLLDVTGQARSGLMVHSGSVDNPVPCGPAIADHLTGLYLSHGILAALLGRARTGIGQRVDVSMLGAQMALQAREITHYLINGAPALSMPSVQGPMWNVFKTQDTWIAISGMQDARWKGFCKVMGLEQIVDDPRFATAAARRQNPDEFLRIVKEVFLTKPAKEWVPALEAEDVFVTHVRSIEDVAEDPQAIANGLIAEVDYPGHGTVKLVGPPVHFSKTPATVRKPSPQLGEHTHEVLLDLGYSEEEIEQLRKDRIV